MKRTSFTIILILGAFVLGFSVNSIIYSRRPQFDPDLNLNLKNLPEMKKVTGIGGIFFKCKDPQKINDWYSKHLGIPTGPYGATFEWHASPDSTIKGQTQWTPFAGSTDYFAPSTKDFMINYRVADLQALVDQLKKEGVPLLDAISVYDYGKFTHLLDPEGNKIELWEPTDPIDPTEPN